MRRAACLGVACALLAGCGGGAPTSRPQPAPRPSAQPQDFPSAKGKTLETLRQGLPSGLILVPSTTASLEVGRNRVGFALRDRANTTISGAAVALYTADHDGAHMRGPFVARAESLRVKPEFLSQTTARDPDAATSLYVAEVPIRHPGRQVITGLARLDGRLVATTGFELPFPRRGLPGRPPEVGDMAVRVHTPTITSAGGDAEAISTRVPPATPMLHADLADVLGTKPAVVVFATPLLCRSRVCGPVVDVAMQVQAAYGHRVAFIQQEVYRHNDVGQGYAPQVRAWRLPTEPWTFVIDRTGRITARFEGALSVGELERAVAKVA